MAQRGEGLCLALEPTVAGALLGCGLDRDGGAGIAVEAAIDDARTALARDALDLEPAVENVADVHRAPSTGSLRFRDNIMKHHARKRF
jgi:hypothetical protein